MNLVVKTQPMNEPVSLSEMKNALGMADFDADCDNYTADDDYISSLIAAAREYCESYQNRTYGLQTLELYLDRFPCQIRIPRPPLIEVSEISYKDCYGVTTILPTTEYVWSNTGFLGVIVPAYGKIFPSFTPYPLDAVKITYTAGHSTVEAIPQKVKQAIKLLTTHWYENRTPIDATRTEPKEIAFSLSALLNIDRVVNV
jgi:uncharacterized phiE125 gp8 family phage protein